MVGDILLAVRDQALTGLDPVPSTVVVAPGAEVAWDDMCGQAWVRVVSAAPRYVRQTSCPFALVLTLGIGVIRCVATINDAGEPPSAAQVTADGKVMGDDMWGLYRALSCFVPEGAEKASLTSWTPLGPLGMSAGGEWAMEVWVT